MNEEAANYEKDNSDWSVKPRENYLPLHECRVIQTTLMVVVAVVDFSSLARILGECSTIHSPPALFFFLKRTLARAHQFHSLGQDQSTVAQQTETTVAECFLTS